MDRDKRSLRVELEENPDADADLHKAIRTRRVIRRILAIVAAIAILAEIYVQYYIGLHK